MLLDERGFAKLTDFGLAKLLKTTELAKTFCGTPEYLAPEVLLNQGCNRPADWWSLGILVYEMLFGAPPFYSKDVQEMYKKTLMNPLRFPSRCNVSAEAKDFVSGLLVKNCTKRLGSIADSLELMSHVWLKDFPFQKLLDYKVEPGFKPSLRSWEDNFDPEFLKELAVDSKCDNNSSLLNKFKTEFD